MTALPPPNPRAVWLGLTGAKRRQLVHQIDSQRGQASVAWIKPMNLTDSLPSKSNGLGEQVGYRFDFRRDMSVRGGKIEGWDITAGRWVPVE